MHTESDGRRSLQRLGELRNLYAGEPCVILGNGPSLRGFDLREIHGFKAFCLNRGYLLWNEQNLTPTFLIAVNELVIDQFSPELQTVPAIKLMPWLLRDRFAQPSNDIVFFEERWDEVFLEDSRQGVATTATVTNSALQLAFHMGFSSVVLLGIDHSFTARGQPHEKVLQTTADPDHFRPDYFAPGTNWHLPDLEQSERGYRLALRAYETAGRRIINATPGTRLDVFERLPLSDALAAVR
jgi:hypothetical protein